MQTTQRIGIHAAIGAAIGTGALAYFAWEELPWWAFPLAFVFVWSYFYNAWVKDAARENMANMMDR